MNKTSFEKIKYNNWEIIFNKNQEKYIDLAKQIIDKREIEIIKELKNSKRSFVGLTQFKDKKIVMKQPRMKHDAFRMKMMTVFFEGEAFSAFKSVTKLISQGFNNIYKPILAMELRKNGMVQDSWFLYSYEEGVKCTTKEKFLEVIDVLDRFHKLGYRHSDANIANFIHNTDDEIVIIDCRAKTNPLGKFGEMFDFVILNKSEKGIEELYPFGKDDIFYRITKKYYYTTIAFRRVFKTIVRLGKKKK